MRFSPFLAVAFCLLAAAVVSPASTSALVMRTTGTQADCQFHQFDFSSMRRDKTMTPPFYNAYYDNYRWQINVCGELEYGAPECEDAGASVCWIDGDVVLGTIQRWNDSTIEWTYYDSENPNWGGVTMSSFNGDPCTGSGGGVPQRVNITFLCNVTQTEFSAVRTPNSCHTEFFVGTPLACGSTSLCGIDNLDFTPLQKSGAQGYYTATDSAGYTYKLNVCGAITGADDQCGENSGAVCQYKHGNEVAMVAKWQGAKAVRWSYNPAEGASPAVASVLYTNGDACYPSMQPRTTRINFVCNPTVTPLTVVPSSDPCTYVFQMGTPITCNYARPADTLASAVEKREAQIRMI